MCSAGTWKESYVTGYTSASIIGAMATSLTSGFLMKFGKFRLLLATNLLLVFGNSMTQSQGV